MCFKICNDILSEGKELCLFYDNPQPAPYIKESGLKISVLDDVFVLNQTI